MQNTMVRRGWGKCPAGEKNKNQELGKKIKRGKKKEENYTKKRGKRP